MRILKHSLSLTVDRRFSATVFCPNSNPTISVRETFRILPKQGLLLLGKVPSWDDVFISALHVKQLWNSDVAPTPTCNCIQTGRGRTLIPWAIRLRPGGCANLRRTRSSSNEHTFTLLGGVWISAGLVSLTPLHNMLSLSIFSSSRNCDVLVRGVSSSVWTCGRGGMLLRRRFLRYRLRLPRQYWALTPLGRIKNPR